MPHPLILVVDDEPLNLEIIAEFLEGDAYRLEFAATGEEAWSLLEVPDSAYDLVVLDRMMPGMNGIELLKRIKADERLSHLPVIMQTAAAAPDQVREGLAAGAYYYLTKPYDPEALQTIVRAALDDAGLPASSAGYINDHGTGTRLNARTEAAAIDVAISNSFAFGGLTAVLVAVRV